MTQMLIDEAEVVDLVRHWLTEVVIQYRFCPFAEGALQSDAVRFSVSFGDDSMELLTEVALECTRLQQDSTIETTLLILPRASTAFDGFLDFMDQISVLIEESDWSGVFQAVPFHPDFLFAGEAEGALSHFTNRSPYPIVHLLREDSVAQAVANHPDTSAIPRHNIARLQALSSAELTRLRHRCARPH